MFVVIRVDQKQAHFIAARSRSLRFSCFRFVLFVFFFFCNGALSFCRLLCRRLIGHSSHPLSAISSRFSLFFHNRTKTSWQAFSLLLNVAVTLILRTEQIYTQFLSYESHPDTYSAVFWFVHNMSPYFDSYIKISFVNYVVVLQKSPAELP